MNVDFVFGDFEAHVIGGSIGKTAFDTATGHEEGEAVWEMVAAEYLAVGGAALTEGSAAEFAAPDDQGVFEQAALFEVFDEGSDGFVGGGHFFGETVGDAIVGSGAVEVPSPIEQVNKACALFDQAAGEKAVVGKGRFAGFGAVSFERFRIFLRDVHDAGDAGLHPVGEFVLSDAGEGLGMGELCGLKFIEFAEGIEGAAAEGTAHSWRVGDEEDGIAFGAALHALKNGGDEAAAPAALAAAGLGAGGDEGDETWEVLIVGAETVSGPSSHGWAALADVTGVEQQLSGRVIELIGLHRVDEAHLIGDLVEVWAGV